MDDSGLVTFKNTGTVTMVVSPDTEGFINNLLKLVNYIYKLDHTGTIDTKKLADILIKYLGIDMTAMCWRRCWTLALPLRILWAILPTLYS